MTRARMAISAAVALAAATLATASPWASPRPEDLPPAEPERPASLCVVGLGALPGATRAVTLRALHIEARKRQLLLAVDQVSSLGDCPRPDGPGANGRAVVEGELLRAELLAGPWHLTVEPAGATGLERAAALAEEVVALLERAATEPPAAIVDTSEPVIWTSAEAPLPDASASAALLPQVAFLAGGRYTYELGAEAHAASLEAEVHAAWFGERLAVGLTGGFTPEQAVPTPRASGEAGASVSRRAGEVGLVVRGGWCAAGWCVRGGVQAGWQWRTLRIDSDVRFRATLRSDDAPWLQADAELLWAPSGGWRVSALGWARWNAPGRDLNWVGARLYTAPDGAAGAAMRLGYVF